MRRDYPPNASKQTKLRDFLVSSHNELLATPWVTVTTLSARFVIIALCDETLIFLVHAWNAEDETGSRIGVEDFNGAAVRADNGVDNSEPEPTSTT